MSNPRLQVDIGANTKEFDNAVKNINSKLNDLSNNLIKTGAAFTKAFTLPIVGAAGVAVKAFDTQIKAEARLRTALEANGREVNTLFQEYKTFASGLQQITTVGDETTLEMLQVAEAMGLTGESAKRAVQNAIAMGKAFGVNEKSAIRYTASLEQGDATMLTRYIPALRGVTDEAEKTALAHDILRKAFGAATAEAQVGLGPVQQLKNNFGDLMEQVGELVSNAIAPFIKRVNNLVLRLQALDKPTKALYTGIALITAAIGPALIAFGSFIKIVTFAISPLVVKIAAIVAIISGISLAIDYAIQNWEGLKARIMDWSWWKNTILDMAAFFSRYAPGMLGGQGEATAMALEAMKTDPEDLGLPSVQSFEEYLSELSSRLSKIIGGMFDLGGGINDFAPGIQSKVVEPLRNVVVPEIQKVEAEFQSATEAALSFMKSTGEGFEEFRVLITSFAEGLTNSIGNAIVGVQNLGDAFRSLVKQLIASGISKLLMGFLTGGLSFGGESIFGKGGGGILGKLLPGVFGAGAPVSMGASLPQLSGANINVGGQFVLKGTDLVGSITKTQNSVLR